MHRLADGLGLRVADVRAEEDVRGGAAYRFAIKIDCKESFVEDPALAFAPSLVALVEEEFGRSFFQFGSLY